MLNVALDRARYFFVPRTTGRRQLALARLLHKRKPKHASPDLEQSAKVMGSAIKTITQAYVDRHIETSGSSPAEEAELDRVVDLLWVALYERLGHWEVFERDGVRRLAANQQPDGFDYASAADEAKLARVVRERLLGTSGVEFTRLSYLEQGEYMLTLWSVIEQGEYGEALSNWIGPDFYEALRDSQSHYEAMIEKRSARERGSSVNLRELGLDLQRTIQNYLIALLAMIRDDDPENIAMIRAALRPIDAVREQLERERVKGRAGQVEPQPEQAPDASELIDLDELIAEEAAVSAEIGIAPEAGE
ncbi:hypothetical protein DB30_06246 [Enhygromyxa salina]|uniref:Uncharacterized protein n=1 Tax=Enhygromyxa salina TaxID=215803 RepID=A0A0C1ZB28_9BACT|nr:hypothetical protein [Enhygromyxa salina]KIG14864.1 hypothetical protein DB30_06246 [Enhygromyxa salina]